MLLAFAPDTPTPRSCSGLNLIKVSGFGAPLASSFTRLIIVSAALVANCWESIELTRVSKCDLLYFLSPIEQSGEALMIGAKAPSIREIFRTIARISDSGITATGGNYAIFKP